MSLTTIRYTFIAPVFGKPRFSYLGSNEDGRLDRIQLEGGYLSYTGASGERLDRPEYHFYIRDHLGNNRMDIDGDGGVWQTVHYYPFGMTMGEGYRIGSQRWTFGGKEMDRVAGLDLLDFEARAYCPATARFLRPDPLASDYHPISPYAYCMNNPLTLIDKDGKEVTLYATNLPNSKKIAKQATHTFITVKNKKGAIRGIFSYGSTIDGVASLFGLGGALTKYPTSQDLNVAKGVDTEHLKIAVSVPVPEGMTQEEFDNKVIETAKSFGDNPEIDYSLNPTEEYEGNCNSSTSTILLKSGVSKDVIDQIKKSLPSFTWGFSSTAKPWTADEQKSAVDSKKFNENRKIDTIDHDYGRKNEKEEEDRREQTRAIYGSVICHVLQYHYVVAYYNRSDFALGI